MAADFLCEAGCSDDRLTVQLQDRVAGQYARCFARSTSDNVLDGWWIRLRILALCAIRSSDYQAGDAVPWKVVAGRGTGASRIGRHRDQQEGEAQRTARKFHGSPPIAIPGTVKITPS